MDNDQLSHLIEIKTKLDKLDGRVDNIDITLVRQNGVLEEHHRRSLANEKGLELIVSELKPVLSHVAIVNFVGKMVIFGISSGLILALLKFVVS